MNISFEAFSYKKKTSVLVIEDSDEESVKCLDDEDNNRDNQGFTNKDNSFQDFANQDDSLQGYVNDEQSLQGYVDDQHNVTDDDMPDLRARKRKVVINDSESEDDNFVRSTKRKRICISDSDDEVSIVKDIKRTTCVIEDEEEQEEEANLDFHNVTNCSNYSLNASYDGENTFDASSEMVLQFLESCTVDQLEVIPSCPRNKAEQIVANQPFNSWIHMVEKLNAIKYFNCQQFLDNCYDYLNEKARFEDLMIQCENLSQMIHSEMKLLGNDTKDLPVQQPTCVNESLDLKGYQIVGLNWMALLHEKNLNGILADQMGLGKTIQALTFLGYLLENGTKGPHLIICPCSTLDNWVREFEKWLPDVDFVIYRGTQEERLYLQKDIIYSDNQVIITTYSMALNAKKDRKFFRKMNLHYLIMDEAHMIKNMKTERYKHLLQLQASRRLLLTGTPLQNDVLELMSLLMFLMPTMFDQDLIKPFLFKNNTSNTQTLHKKEFISKMKKILKPFVLRRLKDDVLKELPEKEHYNILCELNAVQQSSYKSFAIEYSNSENNKSCNGLAAVMKFRKVANHLLLLRKQYSDSILMEMAKQYVQCPFHFDCNVDLVYEDMQVMSDFELHTLCKKENYLKQFKLDNEALCDGGKIKWLDQFLPKFQQQGDRVLLFSQFVIMLDVLEEYLKLRNYTFVRIDGSTAGDKRQELIDEYNSNDSIFIFLLSTKAGGLGINLTTANVVILHDLDFNPYNDKQAEDRCHRMGQTRKVTVYRLISEGTIEENILKRGERKLMLEKEIVGNNENLLGVDESTDDCVLQLLKDSLQDLKSILPSS